MSRKKLTILKEKLVLVEGEDEFYFFINLLQKLDICHDKIQVIPFGGVTRLSDFLKLIRNDDNFREVTDILIYRDAEAAMEGALQSIKESLSGVNITHSGTPFTLERSGNLRIGIGVFYDSDAQGQGGTLEDVLMKMTNDEIAAEHAKNAYNFLMESGMVSERPHKTKVNLYLSCKNETVGLKIGEATAANAWNPESEAFTPYLELLRSICL